MSSGEWPGSDRFLPRDPRVGEPYRFTPKMAIRLAILGVVAVAVFAVLFFRLWALQVISGNEYQREARDNQIRTFRLQPPRGPVLDRDGEPLVTNVPGTVVQLWPAYVPQGQLGTVTARLAEVLEIPVGQLRRKVQALEGDPLTPVIVKTSVRDAKADYLSEHRTEFPGVYITHTQLRRYEDGALASHLLGYVGEISPEELKQLGSAYAGGDRIGKSGIEAAYDSYLRGEPGVGQMRVNALGRRQSDPQPSKLPKAGYAVRLTIDANLQRAAEEALLYGMRLARGNGNWAANGGAIVAMNPRNGEVLAFASGPDYDPKTFAGTPDAKRLQELFGVDESAANNYPMLNRAINGVYPAGSVFKPVTALAALADGLVSTDEVFQCQGELVVDGQTFKNWDEFVNEPMSLRTALANSCDTYFYEVGKIFYAQKRSPLQEWARKMGFGKRSGVDVGPENVGLVPTPAWRKRYFKTEIDRLWTSGDSVQLAIGQGDLLVTPIQMTRFYSLIANGGRLVEPARRQVDRAARCGRGGLRRPAELRREGAARHRPARLRHPGRPGRPLSGNPRRLLRDVVRRLRELPDLDRRQDGDGREVRHPSARVPWPHEAVLAPDGSILVVRLRPDGRADDRGVRRHRERRSRR